LPIACTSRGAARPARQLPDGLAMPDSIERALEAALSDRCCFGQILIQKINDGFVLSHREDEARNDLQTCRSAEEAIEIAKYDDAGNYRPLKTAPNFRHGWRLELGTLDELKRALDYFYPGRLAVFACWKTGQLRTPNLRDTLNRQSGMYRIAAKISDAQLDEIVGDFCRSDGGCLRTILWKRDARGTVSSRKLPNEKFDPTFDQAKALAEPRSSAFADQPSRKATVSREATADKSIPAIATIPLLCQEACNLLVAECRKVVKGE
jgi:DR2241 stabilising domain/4Fe-4S iron-sulfur cluster binding domain